MNSAFGVVNSALFLYCAGVDRTGFFLREISVLFGKMRPCGVVGSERKNFRSKHREKVPFPVFSPSCAYGESVENACWEVSQTLYENGKERRHGIKTDSTNQILLW